MPMTSVITMLRGTSAKMSLCPLEEGESHGGKPAGDIRATAGPEIYYKEHEAQELLWPTVDGLSSRVLVVLND